MRMIVLLIAICCAVPAAAQDYEVWAPPNLIQDGEVLMYWDWSHGGGSFYGMCAEEVILDGGLIFKQVDDCEDLTPGNQRNLLGCDTYPDCPRYVETRGNHFEFTLCYADAENEHFAIRRCDSE